MSALTCKTRGGSSPQGKPRVFFCCYPEDFQPFFEEISDSILKTQNCAIWYFENPEQVPDTEQMETDLGQMQLFVVPVTTKLLTKPNFAMDSAIPFALEKHIPVLPLMQEDGLIELFGKKFGDIQYLDKNQMDDTAIPYEEKLEKYLSSVLVGDELAAKVRAAFDAYIFLSYRKKDRKYAQELMRLIHQNEFCQDIAIWYDEFLTPGENFNEAIADALQKSELFTLVVTPNLVNEPNYVMSTEYPMAKEADKPILPAELVETDKEALKSHYAGLPDCTDAHDSRALSESLLEAVRKLAIQENDSSPEHNFFIGLAYLGGIDVEVDHRRALSLIEGAAEAGLTEAMEKLVSMYRNGESVERNYRTAIEWQAKLVEALRQRFEAEPNEENAVRLAEGYWDQGDYEYELRALKAAENSYRKILRFAESMQEQFPIMKRLFSVSCDKMGEIRQAEGKILEAEEYYRKSLRMDEQLAKETGTVKARRDLSVSYNNMGDIRESEGKFAEAAAYYEKSLQIREQLAEESGTMETKQDLSVSYNCMGRIREAAGKLAEAEEYYRKSLEISEQLIEETGTVEALRDFLVNCNRIGGIQKAAGNFSKAEEYYRRSLQIAERIAEETDTKEAKEDLAAGYNTVGGIREAEGRIAEAMEYYQKGLQLREQLAEETDSMQARKNLAISYHKIGGILWEAGKLSEAGAYYQKFAGTMEPIAEETGALEMKRDLSVSYSQIGDILLIEGELAEAEAYYWKFIRIAEQLDGGTETLQSKLDVSIGYSKIGDVLLAEGKFAEAEESYRKFLQNTEQIALKADTLEINRFLSRGYGQMGMVFRAEEKLSEAAEYFQKCIQSLEQLTASESGVVNLRDDLAVACYNLGVLGKEFTHYLRKAHTIWDELANECPDAPRYQKNRDIVAEMLQNQN